MWKVPEIMATIGPTLEKPEDLRRAIEAGARWFRLPCGYRQRPHLENARCVRASAAEAGVPVQLLMDLPSSRPRTGTMQDLRLALGDRVLFWDPEVSATAPEEFGVFAVPLPGLGGLLCKLGCAQRIWFCDGRLEFIVDELRGLTVLAHLARGNIPLKTSNSVYLPDSSSPYVMVTAADRALLKSFAAAGLVPDWVALSLVSSAEDIQAGRRELREHLSADVRVMAKIETTAALDHADEILREADGLMVARGDLGPAVEFIRLPEAQEHLVEAARRAGKVSVVATQILETFAETGLPQRPELSDLSLIARQQPDALMLGKETVYSARPIECIRLARDVVTYEARRLESRLTRLPGALAASLGRPFVVAIEGPNGSGKSLLCRLLGERLGLPCLRGVPPAWEEPATKARMIHDADWLASAMYFLSGVIESSREAVRGKGDVKIMDRSLWSTLAVHYAHDPSRLELLMPLLELAAGRLKAPDLTIVLEASPAACRRRIARKASAEQELDAASPSSDDFHHREQEFYHWLARQWPKVAFINTEECDLEAVYRKAADLVGELT
jgi:pyruvate kinase/thymidylate kinase